ncbi:reprolysin-like metallopeptidase [Polaribacter porphyrae]|uniref:Fibronectin type-III domain-containing protein n=1 Tax=Polaribacter porphyrae TaxID=1137780 RepID=A0A2S7WQ17_9FLAO|nr:zinc-dependent metalloprotease family protein [Polaribacter porphyrae]PQJ79371.1 hypothetical protein BTO18_09380 [Polaribacter porphyrae]
MKVKNISLLIFFIVFSIQISQSQEIWKKLEKDNYSTERENLYDNEDLPSDYKILSLNIDALNSNLKSNSNQNFITISLPDSNGKLSKFKLSETSNFEIGLQTKFPSIKSYTAQGVDDPTAIAKISIGTDGFHGIVYSANQETLYIDPYSKNNKEYIIYKRSALSKSDEDFKCMVEGDAKKEEAFTSFTKTANDGKLRTYRMALACSGEYAQFHLNRQNVSTNASDTDKKAAVLSAMNTSMTRINGVFEKDLSIKLVLVSDNDKIIFLDASTDEITDGNANTMIDQVQTICDTNIGVANYDIGHVFSVGGDGLAGLGVVCIAGQKARGVTGIANPTGDAYDIDYVIHELGHQFGATHTQNNDCNRTNSTAVEPGSGSTIMGYAGICNPNVLGVGSATGNSDAYFHAVSIEQMWNIITTTGNCATQTATNNTAPTADAGSDYSIPKSTPFKLTGTATDIDGLNSLTYNWEQIDNEVGSMPPQTTNTQGPMFRSLPSKTVPVRYFPSLTAVIAGSSSSTWEVLPSVARDLNFSFLVRDNHAGGGASARDDVKITVTNADTFIITQPATGLTWDVGSNQTITWNKGTTDVAPINCALVNIKLSVDGGLTFPIILKANTSNDGTEDIIIPNNPTTDARIMVEAVDNVFYNINNTNFIINSTTPTFILKDNSGSQTTCNTGNNSIDYVLNFDFVNGFFESVTLSSTGEPSGANVVFNPTTINADGNVTMTVSNLDGKTAQDYQINVLGSSTSINQNINVDLKLTSSNFNNLTLTSPANGATGTDLVEELKWDADTNATSYDVEIATESNFANIVSSENVTTNSYTFTNLTGPQQYFWRVKPKNDCGEGSFTSPFSFTTKTPSYCSSTFTDEAGGSEHILNVTFAGINNNSGNDTADGYQDFTNINTNVLRGQTRQVSVRFDTGGFQDHCYVFIDWNQDFVFDNATERYDLGSRTADVATATLDIIIPNDAKLGATRMRVVLEYDDPGDGYGEGACDADHLTEWGETEDYSVTIVEPVIQPNNYSVLTVSESCVDEDDGTMQISINQSEFTYQVSITGPSTNVNQTLGSLSYSLSGLSPGNYEACITAQELNVTQCYEFTIEESGPVSLKVSSTKQSSKYSFNIDKGTPPYKVYLNEELVGVSSNKIFDLNIKGSGKLQVKTAKDCEGIFQKNIGSIVLRQNPVRDFAEILLPISTVEKNINVLVFDMNGKMILNQNIRRESDNLLIPFKNIAKGVYILKLSLENTNPIKIIKQ